MTDTDPLLVEHEPGITNVEFWNFCAYPGCENRRSKRLGSIYCHPHTLEKQERLSTIVSQTTEATLGLDGESP